MIAGQATHLQLVSIISLNFLRVNKKSVFFLDKVCFFWIIFEIFTKFGETIRKLPKYLETFRETCFEKHLINKVLVIPFVFLYNKCKRAVIGS